MKKREPNTKFIGVISDAIEAANIKKAAIADNSGITRSTMTRIFAGATGVTKPTAKAIVRSINNIAGEPVLDERGTLELAGFDRDDSLTFDFDLGGGARLILDEKYSEKQQKEIVEVMKIAFEIAVRKYAQK